MSPAQGRPRPPAELSAKGRGKGVQPGPRPPRIPLFDTAALHRRLRVPVLAAARRVLDSGRYILGPEVSAFEAEFAQSLGVARALGVSSGTDALQLALKGAGVGPGDEVIVPAMTFIATATAVSALGGRPAFADVEPRGLTLDPARAAERAGPGTKAVIAVHLYGGPADMDALLPWARGRGLAVVEDCAQALGTRCRGRPVGSIGDAGCFSFYPTKNLGAAGDAGAIVAADPGLHEACGVLRNAGREPGHKYEHAAVSNNFRMDELQAAILRVRLRRAEEWTERRRRLAELYREGLSGLPLRLPPEEARGDRHSYHLFVIRLERRDALAAFLAEAGVETGAYYPIPLHLQPAYAGLGHGPGDFPEAERAAREVLALPIHSCLDARALRRICSRIRAFFVTTQPPQLKIRPPAGGANSRRPSPGGGRRFHRRGT